VNHRRDRAPGPASSSPPSQPEPWSAADFELVANWLRGRGGLRLSPQRLSLLQARLQVRLRAQGVESFTQFHDTALRSRSGGPGMQLLIDLSTVNHTSFFREPGTLDFLADRIAESLRGGTARTARVWSAGCSAGQEPYSLVINIEERVPGLTPDRVEVLASDLSLEILQVAARGVYDRRLLADISPERLRRYFLRGLGARSGDVRVAPEVRRLVRFAHFDLLSADWPVPDQLDAVLCRNVAIYFDEPGRLTLLDRLARKLKPGGWLAVGSCEILPERAGLLEKVAPSIFRKSLT
jgi:chemotaxis protein methyltransferase CheR